MFDSHPELKEREEKNMLKFEGIHYNNQKWQLVANDGKVLFEGDYIFRAERRRLNYTELAKPSSESICLTSLVRPLMPYPEKT